MSVNKRKKFSRQRATHTHGWGSKKKHRGAGSRGGRGLAGTGKRADQNKTKHWSNTKYFGKFGFTSKVVKEYIKAINISTIEEKLDTLVNKKIAVKEGAVFVVDLGKMGFNKLLGSGNIINKLKPDLTPLIIPPTLDKSTFYSHKILQGLWQRAGAKIWRGCNKN